MNQSSSTTLLVPPRRFGELLVQRRTASGLSSSDIERAAMGRFSAGELLMFESGQIAPDDEQLRQLARLYSLDLSSISPQRAVLELDLREGLVQIGHEAERFSPDQDDREILLRYLALVYRMRSINPGVAIPAREGDLATLADVFSTSQSEIRSTLESLMLAERPEIGRRMSDLRRRLIVPGLGVLVALTTVGGLLLVRTAGGGAPDPSTPKPSLTVPASVPVEINDAVVIQRGSTPTNVNIGDALVIER